MQNLNSKIVLNNGVEMPIIGFGVFRLAEGEEVYNTVKNALLAGYRLIDTASQYKNEEGVGRAIRESGIPREEIFVTTKLWNTDQGYESALKAIDVSLAKLGLDYVDLYLIHWPTATGELRTGESINKREETWRAMEEIYKSGKAKAIGVSNYMINHLEDMKRYHKVVPAVNQFEFHPFLYLEELINYCKQNGIAVEAHSPFFDCKGADNEVIQKLATKYNKTWTQIVLRWSIQHGAIPIPKSAQIKRIKENLNVYDFEISAEDMQALNGLSQNFHARVDPTNFK
ncbi:MAG: aldo/keto reductase [Candidatus Pacebacteria bacterium]|nr:aldo/keto reductase [Candidatus Paceibacterota bacterium]